MGLTMKHVIVAGSRKFRNMKFIVKKLDKYLGKYKKSEIKIITGAAPGPDSIAIVWANMRGYDWALMPAEWGLHGKAAGPIRNKWMSKVAGKSGMLIAFWDGKSPGTKDIIKCCRAVGMKKKNRKVIKI